MAKARTKKAPKPKAEAAPPKKRPKQGWIDGMEPPSIKAIDEAAELYVGYRDSRMATLAKEIEAHDNLKALMIEHALRTYEFDGYTVDLVGVEKCKVKRKKDADTDT